ncbi:YdcF family protein [Nocardia amikacinitolerans]|uniref:YdcF family protein n=1 Tax=Nocardia amikacinitolerans TaxID=756689 RepID=UPI0020A4471D|nr:YdcF family protein [Nocardia amikacinitolerans]MCP2279861.1 DUF218 domain-containing protein [Nocardia amikacinitolerans]
MTSVALPNRLRSDVEVLWDYNQLHQRVGAADLGIGLGSHDLGVATWTAALYRQRTFPLIVFSGGNSPTTIGTFPRGEAVHYREHAIDLGVPESAILIEPAATNTGQNITFTQALLEQNGRLDSIESVVLICRPYQQRRSYAVCRKLWPGVDVVCTSLPVPLDEYIDRIGDVDRVITMLVGDTQRTWVYPRKGWAIHMDVPDEVRNAYLRLVDAGYTGRLLPE